MADRTEARPRILQEDGNPDHRVRVEHNRDTILIHLSEESGHGWLAVAVDRPSRQWAVATADRQTDAAEAACSQLYAERDDDPGSA